MTEIEAQKIVTVIAAAWPGQVSRLTPTQQADQQRIYRRMLGDLPYPVVNAAVERLLATAKFLPTIAEIREACVFVADGDKRTGLEAWGDVVRAMSRQGAYRVPGVDFFWRDPIVARCVSALSWPELCGSELVSSERARFIEAYDRIATAERTTQQTHGLPAADRLRELRSTPTNQRDAHSNQLTAGEAVGAVLKQISGAK